MTETLGRELKRRGRRVEGRDLKVGEKMQVEERTDKKG